MRILDGEQVTRLLPMDECIAAMEEVMASLARDELFNPLRQALRPPGADNLMGLMTAYRAGASYALKAVVVAPANSARGLDPHQGTVTLFDGVTGIPRAVLNASAITAIRTAAVSALATRTLMRKDARTLAILGRGHQGGPHREAHRAVHEWERIVMWSPSYVEEAATAEEAVREADVVVTVTSAREPILSRSWLKPGTQITAAGSSIPTTRELDSQTMADGSLFVDRRESTINEAGDYLFPMREGLFGPEHIKAELGEVLIGGHPGRTSDDELTVYKSLGLAVQDLAAAEHVLRRAEAENVGTVVPL
ncbi:MAG TPA: ornithine cyclodeaminase family protein [Gaiellaceae bacterium]|nr:ornithine cyclodeaminase family protein [Gaiellaceae bacterium]